MQNMRKAMIARFQIEYQMENNQDLDVKYSATMVILPRNKHANKQNFSYFTWNTWNHIPRVKVTDTNAHNSMYSRTNYYERFNVWN